MTQGPRASLLVAVGLAVPLGLAAGPAQAGPASCLGELFAETDREQVVAARARIDAACGCADFDGVSPGGKARDYKRCVKSELKSAVAGGELRKPCRGLVRKTYARSLCGAKPGKVACVEKKLRSGRTRCRLVEPARCVEKPGKRTAVACTGARSCQEAADSDADFRITKADDGSCASPDPNEEETASIGLLALVSPDPLAPHPTDTTLEFSVVGAEVDPAYVTVLANEALVPDDRVEVDAQSIRVLGPLVDGRNDVVVYAVDTSGGHVFAEATIWAGDWLLAAHVFDPGGAPAAAADVVLRLGDDARVSAAGTTVGGVAQFTGLPGRTFLVEARSPTGGIASAGVAPLDASSVALQLIGLFPPSPIDNNDFSQGTAGWEIGTATVTIDPHDEDDAINLPRGVVDDDLTLVTEGEGAVSISRSFVAGPEVRGLKVRYRFVTSEIPGGFFGTEFNDYFSVTIRAGSRTISETNSMNGLGSGVFDADGATTWREATLFPISPADPVQVDITVANVADDLWQSAVVVDFIEPASLAITNLVLLDVDDMPLTHLSAATHPYFSGVAPIHGTLTVAGPEGEMLEAVELRVVQNGFHAATAALSQVAEPQLLTQFPSSEEILIPSPVRLFDLPGGGLDASENGTVRLEAVARLADGSEAKLEFPVPIPILDHWTGGNRFTGRDAGQGGDGWVKPSVRNVAVPLGLSYGDFSNMHAGAFPPHASHRTGNDIDAWFQGYNNLDAATAARLIGHLNHPGHGPRITAVFVTYERTATNPFWQAIQNVTLLDGRPARDVIRPEAHHDTHVHYRIAD